MLPWHKTFLLPLSSTVLQYLPEATQEGQWILYNSIHYGEEAAAEGGRRESKAIVKEPYEAHLFGNKFQRT